VLVHLLDVEVSMSVSNLLLDPSFEAPVVDEVGPGGSPWTFAGIGGLVNGSELGSGYPVAYDGSQYAYLQGGTAAQSYSAPDGPVTVSGWVCAPPGESGEFLLCVAVGSTTFTFTIPPGLGGACGSWTPWSFGPIALPDAAGPVVFSSGSANQVLLDLVSVELYVPPAPTTTVAKGLPYCPPPAGLKGRPFGRGLSGRGGRR
jgi:hypothetical protein